MKKSHLLARFYQASLIGTWLVTGICIFLVYQFGFSVVISTIWFKLISLGLTMAFVYRKKKDEFHYYLNLGIKTPALLALVGVLDFSMFLMLILITAV